MLSLIHQFTNLAEQRAVLVWGVVGAEHVFPIRAKQLVDLQLLAAAFRAAR